MRDSLLLTGLVVALLLVSFFAKIPKPSEILNQNQTSSTPVAKNSEEVTFSAPDGYELSATYYPSKQSGQSPAVILVHQFASERHDFDAFIPTLLDNGYSVLAYDIRGFGKSSHGSASITDYPKDITGAVTFLSRQGGVAKDKIAVLGASVGANVAFVASGIDPRVKATVVLSPSNTGALSPSNVSNFNPHNILIASDEAEKPDANAVFAASGQVKVQKVYPGAGHGVEILKNAQAQKDILDFLKNLL